jgi:hypothetical protein
MARKKQASWQFKFTMALSILMFFLIFAYFTESFLEIRKVKPVSVAIEKINSSIGVTPVTLEVEPESKENIKIDNVDVDLSFE